MPLVNVDPDKPMAQILDDIRSSAIESLNNRHAGFNIAPFTTLLVRLSRDATETSNKHLLAQQRLTALLDTLGAEAKARADTALEITRELTKNTNHLLTANREASQTADKTLAITDRLYKATIWLVAMTVLLLMFTLGLFGLEFQKHYQEANTAYHREQVQNKQEQKTNTDPVEKIN
jgi:hypothetical protein